LNNSRPLNQISKLIHFYLQWVTRNGNGNHLDLAVRCGHGRGDRGTASGRSLHSGPGFHRPRVGVEKGVVIDAFHRGHLRQAVQEKLLANIDAQFLRLESGETEEPNEQEPPPDRTDANNPTESLGAK